MKRFFYLISTLLLIACADDVETPAHQLLTEARSALAQNDFDEARALIDSLRTAYPKAVNARREALAFADSIELVQAKHDWQVADSVKSFKVFELADLKSKFVLEKDAKYQSVGNYVTPEQTGDKSRFKYFSEVNEQGTMMLVSVDTQRKYHPTEIDVTGDSFEGVYPAGFSSVDMSAFNQCYALAKLFKDVKEATEAEEKFAMKIKFYERKIQENSNSGK